MLSRQKCTQSVYLFLFFLFYLYIAFNPLYLGDPKNSSGLFVLYYIFTTLFFWFVTIIGGLIVGIYLVSFLIWLGWHSDQKSWKIFKSNIF